MAITAVIGSIFKILTGIAPFIASAIRGKGSLKSKAWELLTNFLSMRSGDSVNDVHLRLKHLDKKAFLRLKELDAEFRRQVAADKHEIIMLEGSIKKEMVLIAKEDAKSTDKFQSRWRPFIAWVCGGAFAYYFLLVPIAMSVMAISIAFGVDPATITLIKAHLPLFDMAALMTMLGYLLGYGGFRTFEKTKKLNE